MNVVLIFTSNELNPNFADLSFRDESIGYIPPLSLVSVAAIFEREGVAVDLLDMDAEGLSYSQALQRVRDASPDLIGFTLSTYSFHPILTWIRKFKEDTGLPIIVGGAHVALYPEETMSHPEIDYVVVGEAELPLPPFIRAFTTDRDFSGLKSVGYREDGRVIIDRTRQHIPDIDDAPWPARHLLNNELYSNILSHRKNFTAMLSTRGCPYRCAFCDQKTPKYRIRSPRSFVDEVTFNCREFGIHEFDVYDSTFTANKKRVLEICRLLVEEQVDVSWTVRSRVDSVNKDMLDALRRAGCHTVMYGIESSDRDILKRMRKDISPERVREIVGHSKKVGFEVLGFFMFGFPGETRETIEDTIRFSLELPLDYAQFTVIVPFPDTEIYEYYMANGLEDYWAEYTLDPSKERLIELIGTEITRDDASRYLSLAYRRFYYRPRVIWHRARSVRSFGELRRLARGAWAILKNSLSGHRVSKEPCSPEN